jgi:DNA modification methylase
MIKENLNIVEYNTSDLIFAEYNPRELTNQQHQDLKDSITRFGFVDPLIVNINKNRKNILIGGHQRLKIAKELLYKKVPCVEVDLTPEKEKELNVRLNKNTGQWDWDVLANQFKVGDLLEWGFNEDELQFKEPEEVQGLTDDDHIPEVEEATTQPGDLWILGKHRLLCGDATKKEDVERLMDGQMADMVFTDPPYGLGGYGGRNKMALQGDDQDVTPFYSSIPNADEIYVWGRVYNLLDINFKPRDIIIWRKNNFGLGKGYRGQYEVCFYKGEFKGSDSDVWDISKDTNYIHPTQKPVELCCRAIKNSNPKQILDLFLGSGSTLIACEKTNRKCYGMEIDTNYCDVIVKRWEDYTGNKAERVKNAD